MTQRNTTFTRNRKTPLDGTEYLAIIDNPTSASPTPRGTLTQDIADLINITTVDPNQQTDSYTLVAADAGKLVNLTKGTAVNLTVPPDTEVDYPLWTLIGLSQGGAGTVTVVAGSGVTLHSLNSKVALSGQYAVASLLKTAPNTYLLFGALA